MRKKKRPKQEERLNVADAITAYDELSQLREEHPEIITEVNPKYEKKTIMERLLGFYLSMRTFSH